MASYSQKTYAQRGKEHAHPLVKELFATMERKQSNLSLAADVSTKAELLALADTVGPYICVLKTHIDVVSDFDADLVERLQALAAKHDFLIFEDRKFADIGNTVKLQYGGGIYRIADWAHITNCHVIPGEGIIQGLAEVGKPKGRGLLLLAEMSSAGMLATGAYTDKNVEMAIANDFVIGFIGSRRFTEERDLITMTPGVGLHASGDALGQQYRTPTKIITENGSDIIIVGRGIYGPGKDAAAEAQRYREAGWTAYLNRLGPK
ncbi:orotidine 5'-phosphate decarboxylase [Coemansia sp. RSA 376]|nr:orotidine 5'-phosphate decarboxylase [Coemansia sp. S680]KAJ2033541.1 orotidine 5'-phosphate decarboxylase [Coemansia sp. S3946]KAJ2049975.1 orotidine 5'-phosphate decarboxylase [Coemansia sp. S16]KAJ2106288.1 orotidine 5'-phosphate decarboxylase [Coemansia sp. RSA 922]KAJ2263786.1 orotidine 5'-phosphate decarboxylase [Coemansia sp. RSA 376]KAJ2327323.1 orotidine 5'-phosphate decarboxylase [Coemansia sp. RSA 2673]